MPGSLHTHSHPAALRARSVVARRPREGGFAMLLMVFLLMLGAASVGLTFYRPSPTAALVDDRTADVFAEVKTALIGYAARQGVFQCADPTNATACQNELNNSSKLGEFPCPDIDNDGIAEASCATERLGRVPWKTLGIPEPKDSAGETLWYAVSLRFLNNASNPILKNGVYATVGSLNSSTPGDLTVRAPDGTTITTAAIAVIFSPGSALGTQNRSQTVLAYCSASKPSLLRHLCPANYLDTFGTTFNGTIGGPFILGTPGDTFNDRLVYISAPELMPILEMRLGKEMQDLLLEYKYNAKCFCFPWADSWNYSGGMADVGVNRGRLPTTAQPEDWGTGTIPIFPPWVKDNDWHNQLFYAASNNETDNAGGGCLTCSTSADLIVQRTPATGSPTDPAAALFITPGTPAPGVDRPFIPYVAVNTAASDVFASYFEDPLNDKTSCPGNATEHFDNPSSFPKVTASLACDTVVRPQSRAYDRDRLWIIPPETPATMCPRAGPALVNNTPCKLSGNTDKPVCTTIVGKLQQCSSGCAAAAREMVASPCRNDQSSSRCPPFTAALLACTS